MANPESDQAAIEIAQHLGIYLTQAELFEQVAIGSRILPDEELDQLLKETS